MSGRKRLTILASAMLMLAIITMRLHLMSPAAPSQAVGSLCQSASRSSEPLPRSFTANLTSPPMFVSCWNSYTENGEVIGEIAERRVSGEGNTRFDFFHSINMWSASNLASTGYLQGEEKGYALLYTRVDTEHEVQEDVGGYFLIASFYIPEVAEDIKANVSFRFEVEYWLYADESGGGDLVIDLAHWDVDLAILEYSPATGEWIMHAWELVPSYNMSWALSNVIVDWQVLRYKSHFSYDLSRHKGPWWIGVRLWLESEVRGHGQGADTWGCARVQTLLTISDLKISVSYTKRAFEEAEVRYVDPANHTAVVRPNEPVNHTIRYGIAYSHTWDAFRFTIYVPDYADSLVSPVYETGHEDGLITGTFTTTSPNYVKRLSACIWGKDAKMLVVAHFRTRKNGVATLRLYEPDGAVAYNHTWKIDDYAEEILVDDWIKCSVLVYVLDENGNPVADATVEVYDAKGELAAVGQTNGAGYVIFILPHQGRYYFHAYHEGRHGYRNSAVYPLMSVDFIGAFPELLSWGYLEIGFKRTGYPMAPSYNLVKIVLETEATLYVNAIGVIPPWPYRLTWVNVSVTVRDEKSNVIATGITPFEVALQTGTYYVTVPENTTAYGWELRFAFWLLVDSPPTNRTATVNLWMDRHIYAVYVHGFLLNISSLLAEVLKPFGEALIAVLDSGDLTPIYTALGTIEMPRVVWTGVTPCTAVLPAGSYVVVAHQYEPENYTVVGWEGVDRNIGRIRLPPLNMVLVGAEVTLAQDRDISCLHELEEGKEPLLIVRSKLIDGTEFMELPLIVMDLSYYLTNKGYYVETKTPYREYAKRRYVLEVPVITEAGWEFVGWEGVDLANETTAFVNCSLGRLVWAVYVQASGGGPNSQLGTESSPCLNCSTCCLETDFPLHVLATQGVGDVSRVLRTRCS